MHKKNLEKFTIDFSGHKSRVHCFIICINIINRIHIIVLINIIIILIIYLIVLVNYILSTKIKSNKIYKILIKQEFTKLFLKQPHSK